MSRPPRLERRGSSRTGRRRRFLQRLNSKVAGGLLLTIAVCLLALLAPIIATHDPLQVDMARRLSPPSAEHLFGTDNNGRDLFSRVVFGARVSIGVGATVVITTTAFGTIIGIIAGYLSRFDGVLMRIMDALLTFPSILLAISIMAALGRGTENVILALTLALTPLTARVVRGKILSVREETYVESAQAVGLPAWYIMRRYLLPNILAPITVQATFILAVSIIAEAGLSFVGVGIPPPAPSWGNILSDGRAFMVVAPWMATIPGIFIMISTIGFNVLGDGLRDLIDPHLSRGQPLVT